MTLQNLDMNRVMRAVVITFVVSIALSMMASCFLMFALFAGSNSFANQFDESRSTLEDPETSQETIENEIDKLQDALFTTLTEEAGTEVTIHYVIQWTLAALIAFNVAQRTARSAPTPQEAAGTGLAIGIGVAFSYGILCVMCSATFVILRLVFFGLLIMAGYSAGQVASQNLGSRPVPPRPANGPTQSSRSRSAPFGTAPRATATPSINQSADPQIYYNLGVQAAMGGRRNEAREHFSRVIQYQPRNVQAWLQLANLSDTPDQAWNYILQARSIAPDDPQVQEAVKVIWPKVSAQAKSPASGALAGKPPEATPTPTDDTAVPPFDPDEPDTNQAPDHEENDPF